MNSLESNMAEQTIKDQDKKDKKAIRTIDLFKEFGNSLKHQKTPEGGTNYEQKCCGSC